MSTTEQIALKPNAKSFALWCFIVLSCSMRWKEAFSGPQDVIAFHLGKILKKRVKGRLGICT